MPTNFKGKSSQSTRIHDTSRYNRQEVPNISYSGDKFRPFNTSMTDRIKTQDHLPNNSRRNNNNPALTHNKLVISPQQPFNQSKIMLEILSMMTCLETTRYLL